MMETTLFMVPLWAKWDYAPHMDFLKLAMTSLSHTWIPSIKIVLALMNILWIALGIPILL